MSVGTVNKIRPAILAALMLSAVISGKHDSVFIGTAQAQAAVPAEREAPRGQARGLSPSWYDGKQPIFRYRVDPVRNRAWVLAADGVHVYDLGTQKRIGSATLRDWIWAGEPYSCSPDMVLGPGGEAIVSSDVLPSLWRVDPVTLVVSRHDLSLDQDADKDVGFSGLVYSANENAFLGVSHFHGSLWRIDLSLRRARKVVLATPVRGACGRGATSSALGWENEEGLSLCIAGGGGGRQVRMASGLRSGHVVARACKDED